MKVKENIGCKFLIGKAGALCLIRGCLKSLCTVIASEAKQTRALIFNGLFRANALAMTGHRLLRQPRAGLRICLLLALSTATVINAYSKNNDDAQSTPAPDTTVQGVIINGVKWATCNVAVWSSTPYHKTLAYYLYFREDANWSGIVSRNYGNSVRPVAE